MSDDPNATTRRGDTLTPVPTPLAVGGRYVLGDEIARGGMGIVLRATDTVLGREVAVKVLQEQFGPESAAARRFVDEARITAQLQHPAIPAVHDLGTLPDRRPFLAMKLIKGDTLDVLLSARPDPSAERGRFVAAFESVCQAVAFAHARDVIHRDLKPANVMVGAFGEVQVMDWGLAKVLPSRGRESPESTPAEPVEVKTEVRSLRDSDGEATQAGAVLGTPAYMSPEQAVGAVDQIDARSDVFALGGILAAVLTGVAPFRGDTAEATRVKAAQGKVEECFARLDASGAEPELVALAKRCLSPAREDRPADAAAVATAVGELRQAAEARARQAELDRVKAEATVVEGRKRRRVQLGLAAAVVLLVAGAGAVAVWRALAQRERTARAADAVAVLLDQAKAALEADDAERAAPFVEQAARRVADDAVAAHADRLVAYQRDLAMVRALDQVDDFRWTPRGSNIPPAREVVERWAAAFAGYGIVPGTTPPAGVVARLKDSPIRKSLLAALDGWLARAPAEPVRALLGAADPDPFRDEVRRLLAAPQEMSLTALATRPEWAAQPSGLVRAYAASPHVPAAVQRGLLARAVRSRTTDFGLLMQVGRAYPLNTTETAADRARWYQAAVALRPRSVVAAYTLGMALYDGRDLDGAAAVYREAIRLDPNLAPPHNGLGNVLRDKGDAAGAAAAFREAIRLDPEYVLPHNNLGLVLRDEGDLDAAAAAFREAIRLDPKLAPPHNGLGNVLRDKGDAAGATAAYREAIRLDPKFATPHNNLGIDYESRLELDAAAGSYREAIRLNPRFAVAHANLGDVYRKQGRHDEAVVTYRAALAIQPNLGFARDGLAYCERVLRGEVPTAPPPRAVAR